MKKIITPQDGILYYSPADGNDNNFDRSEMDQEVNTYWDGNPEKRFIIPFWKAKQLIQKSNMNQLAIKLTNLSDRDNIDGEWLSLDASIGDINVTNDANTVVEINGGAIKITSTVINLESDVNEEVVYYAFGKALLKSFEDGFNGIPASARPLEKDRTINVRIGKNTIQNIDHYFAYFILGEVSLHLGSTGSGGPSAACGAKIPPGR